MSRWRPALRPAAEGVGAFTPATRVEGWTASSSSWTHASNWEEGSAFQQRRGRWGASRWAVTGRGDAASKNETGSPRSRGETVWYFGFGANINPWKLRERRKIIPIEQVAGQLPGWRLMFNHKGGMGNIERLGTGASRGPQAVHGMLLLLKPADFDRLAQMEHEYEITEVSVNAYDGRQIPARAFVTPPAFRLQSSMPPPERYRKLIADGAKEMKLDEEYVEWLGNLPSEKGQRGPTYYDVPAKRAKPAKRETAVAGEGGQLRLHELKRFGACGDLIEIGANMGKCSNVDLVHQLVRASAAGVAVVILTGCSVKGSQTAFRICEEWNGKDAFERAMVLLGAAARHETNAANISHLPSLSFTAGVHPHDAKSCGKDTIDILRGLAQSPFCVAIGECGLDYDRMFSPRDVQIEWFRRQAELAVELGMPLFLHERDRDRNKGQPLGSARDFVKILDETSVHPSRVCVHCFTGTEDCLRTYVDRGYFVGLTGFVGLKKRGAHIRRALEAGSLPLERLMLETDCPFMMPDGEYLPQEIKITDRKNEPCAMPAVCHAAAECYGVPAADVAQATTATARKFFPRLC